MPRRVKQILAEDRITRTPSDLLVEVHVYILPQDKWIPFRRLARNQVVEETVSAGFIRVLPDVTLHELRPELLGQLNDDLPENYVFIKSVGRNFTQVKPHQEHVVKVKSFLPPHAAEPEIHVLELSEELLRYAPSLSNLLASDNEFSDSQGTNSRLNHFDAFRRRENFQLWEDGFPRTLEGDDEERGRASGESVGTDVADEGGGRYEVGRWVEGAELWEASRGDALVQPRRRESFVRKGERRGEERRKVHQDHMRATERDPRTYGVVGDRNVNKQDGIVNNTRQWAVNDGWDGEINSGFDEDPNDENYRRANVRGTNYRQGEGMSNEESEEINDRWHELVVDPPHRGMMRRRQGEIVDKRDRKLSDTQDGGTSDGRAGGTSDGHDELTSDEREGGTSDGQDEGTSDGQNNNGKENARRKTVARRKGRVEARRDGHSDSRGDSQHDRHNQLPRTHAEPRSHANPPKPKPQTEPSPSLLRPTPYPEPTSETRVELREREEKGKGREEPKED
nr:uncharacterized protein LOC128694480 [Cherax quadricarinatus]